MTVRLYELAHKLVASPVATTLFLATIATTIAAFQNQWIKEKLILRPYAFVHRKQYFTVVTSGFIHADWMHLFMNMLAFWLYGLVLERDFVYMQCEQVGDIPDEATQRLNEIVGHSKFLIIYFASMVVADFSTIAKYKDIPSYACLGASGAISGIVMSKVIIAPAMHQSFAIFGIIPGWVFALLFLTYSYIAARRMMDNVAHEAHLWGALAGIGFTFLLFPHQSWEFIEMLHHTFLGVYRTIRGEA